MRRATRSEKARFRPSRKPGRGGRPSSCLLALIGVLIVVGAACGGGQSGQQTLVVRSADQVQIVSADEAKQLLDEGESRAASSGDRERNTATTVAVEESSRSFQTRLGTALTTFNSCLAELGLRFVGIPGQTDDPLADDPDYLPALISCNNESGIGEVLQEQNERQSDLSPEQKRKLNEDGKSVFECLVDRGWDFGPLEPNENGILTASSFPDDINVRADEFGRDLDACGWNDLELG